MVGRAIRQKWVKSRILRVQSFICFRFVTISLGLSACNSSGHLSNHAEVAPSHAGITFAISNTLVSIFSLIIALVKWLKLQPNMGDFKNNASISLINVYRLSKADLLLKLIL